MIRYWRDNDDIEKHVTDVNTTTYSLFDLQPSTNYYFQVAGMTDSGVGVFENISTSTLPCKHYYRHTHTLTIAIMYDL